MKASTVNISFNKRFLSQIDRVARTESRSRSELIREAARLYIEKKQAWANIFAYAGKQATQQGLQEKDIQTEISRYRKAKQKKHA